MFSFTPGSAPMPNEAPDMFLSRLLAMLTQGGTAFGASAGGGAMGGAFAPQLATLPQPKALEPLVAQGPAPQPLLEQPQVAQAPAPAMPQTMAKPNPMSQPQIAQRPAPRPSGPRSWLGSEVFGQRSGFGSGWMGRL